MTKPDICTFVRCRNTGNCYTAEIRGQATYDSELLSRRNVVPRMTTCSVRMAAAVVDTDTAASDLFGRGKPLAQSTGTYGW